MHSVQKISKAGRQATSIYELYKVTRKSYIETSKTRFDIKSLAIGLCTICYIYKIEESTDLLTKPRPGFGLMMTLYTRDHGRVPALTRLLDLALACFGALPLFGCCVHEFETLHSLPCLSSR
jgi:hypothetical protein